MCSNICSPRYQCAIVVPRHCSRSSPSPHEPTSKQREQMALYFICTSSQVSHYIVVCMRRRPSKTGKLNPEWEDLASVACAVQVRGVGLGSRKLALLAMLQAHQNCFTAASTLTTHPARRTCTCWLLRLD